MKGARAIVALVVTGALLVVGSGMAMAWDWYTPYTGYTTADEDYYYIRGKWSSASVEDYRWWDAWEGELRGESETIDNYYSGLGTNWGGTFPGKYRELDGDDVTMGMASPHLMSSETNYYGYTYLTAAEGQPDSFDALVESELGYDYGGLPDPIPQDWETLLTFELPGSDSW